MARFQDSIPMPNAPLRELQAAGGAVQDRSIGDILAELRNLSAEQVERVLQHQRTQGVRFGEAAVALGMATQDDVLFALSQQFHYPYAPEEQRNVSPELVMLREPFSPRAEAFRALRSQLMMRVFADDAAALRRAVAVISPDSGDGKSYCAANLAVALAQLGGRARCWSMPTCARRGCTSCSAWTTAPACRGILSGRSDSQVIQQVAGVGSLFVLPVGITPPNPLELVERPAFGLLMRELTAKFDHVIVDTPAAVRGADAGVIAARCGAALVVARRHSSRLAALQDLLASFSGSDHAGRGVVFNEH